MMNPDKSGDDGISPAEVRDAACVVVVDRRRGAPKMLMGRRRETQIFMPNKWVFPGGRVDQEDRELAAQWRLHTSEPPSLPDLLQPFALAAVRELLEETGHAMGRVGRSGMNLPGAWQAFSDLSLTPDLAPMAPLARAITPPGLVRRYDTWFFLADATAVASRPHAGDGELLDLGWFTLAEAEALNVAGITRMVLADLASVLPSGRAPPRSAVPFYHYESGRYQRTHCSY